MAESRVKDENYFQVSGFMVNRLRLKGVALNVYAIIYGFSQDGETEFTGSLQYLCDFCGGVSKPTIISALKELVKNDYILKREEIINGVQFNRYKANLPLLKKFNGGNENNCCEVVKNFNGGSKETLPNIKSNNKSFNNNKNNNSTENDFETLWKMYPRKIGKPQALKAYQKAVKNGVTFETVKAGLEAYCRHIEANKTEAAYIKHGSTWFNGECWNDEYNTVNKPAAAAAIDLNGGLNI